MSLSVVGNLGVVGDGIPLIAAVTGAAFLSDEEFDDVPTAGRPWLRVTSFPPEALASSVLSGPAVSSTSDRLADIAVDVTAPPGPGKCISEAEAWKSGGGSKSCRDVDAAYAIASAPYGIPKRANASREEISLSCSGVGPAFGYVNSVRVRVWVSGADMELSEMEEGEVMWLEFIVLMDR